MMCHLRQLATPLCDMNDRKMHNKRESNIGIIVLLRNNAGLTEQGYELHILSQSETHISTIKLTTFLPNTKIFI